MPELPEVEVLRRGLEPHVVGQSIVAAEITAPSLREPLDRRRLRGDTAGRGVLQVRRRAKYLLLDLEGDRTLVVHLGMSGSLTVVDPDQELRRHDHATFLLSSGRALRLNDPRRFGQLFLVRTSRLEADRRFSHLGMEPLSEDFCGDWLRRRAAGRRAPVKSFLMDARNVVGVGNIYASEALHRAGIDPRRSVGRISSLRWQRLAEAVAAVLNQAIYEGGTTLSDFRDADGGKGYFQVSLAVYGRDGADCASCGTAIRRVVQTGRSTYFCPRCQR